jgi:hypothetical protein
MPNSKESKTDTTVEPDITTQLLEAIEVLKKAAEKVPELEKEFDAINYFVKTLKEHDVLLEYKVVAYSKDGEIFNVSGINNLPRLFDESMLPEAPSNFENAFNSSIIRPALNAFLKHVRDKVEEHKKVSMSLSQAFALPTTSEQTGYISE